MHSVVPSACDALWGGLQVPAGKNPFFRIPVFNYHQGYLSVNYSDNYFLLSQRHADVPRLTTEQYEAMKVSHVKVGHVLCFSVDDCYSSLTACAVPVLTDGSTEVSGPAVFSVRQRKDFGCGCNASWIWSILLGCFSPSCKDRNGL